MRTGVDPWPRIEFYVRNGLVKAMPTTEQLRKASSRNAYATTPVERLNYYIRHPLHLLPTEAKRRQLRRVAFKTVAESHDSQGTAVATAGRDTGNGIANKVPHLLTDRILSYTFQFTPARFAVQCYFNPWNATTGTGLNVPLKYLIEHVVHAPAPSSLWDVQIIHPDAGGLDRLEREIEWVANGSGMKSRIYRALVQDTDYYDYLRDLVTRVRRFDYPPPPPGYNPIFENLVNFLNYAVTL